VVGPGLQDRLRRHPEGEPRDDHQLQGLPLHVDPLPEGVGAEEDRIGLLPEPAQEVVPVDLPLAHGGEAPAPEGLRHPAVEPGQEVVGGEEDEGVAVGDGEPLVEGHLQGLLEAPGRGLGKIGGYADEGLALVVEGGGQEELRHPPPVQEIDAGPPLQVVEGLPHRQGGRGDHHGPEGVEDGPLEGGGHLQGGGAEPHSHPLGPLLHLEPAADLVVPADKEEEVRCQGFKPSRNSPEIHEEPGELFLDRFGEPTAPREKFLQLPHESVQVRGQFPCLVVGLLPELRAEEGRCDPELPLAAFRPLPLQVGQEGEADGVHGPDGAGDQLLRAGDELFLQPLGQLPVKVVQLHRHLPGELGRQLGKEPPLGLARVLEPPQELQYPLAGDLGGEVPRGHVLQMVPFVHHEALEGGEDGGGAVAGLLAQGHVGHEEGVVHHEDVGAGRLAPGTVEEAAGVEGALDPAALVRLAGHLLPGFGLGDEGEVAAASLGGMLAPGDDRLQFSGSRVVGEEGGLAFDAGQFPEAEVVGAPLHEDRPELDPGVALEKGDVFLDELFLEVDGVGGDDDPLLVADGPKDRRHQVGEGFAGAGAGLDDRHPVIVEGFGDGKGHPELLVPVLVAGEVRGQDPGRREDPLDFGE